MYVIYVIVTLSLCCYAVLNADLFEKSYHWCVDILFKGSRNPRYVMRACYQSIAFMSLCGQKMKPSGHTKSHHRHNGEDVNLTGTLNHFKL